MNVKVFLIPGSYVLLASRLTGHGNSQEPMIALGGHPSPGHLRGPSPLRPRKCPEMDPPLGTEGT